QRIWGSDALAKAWLDAAMENPTGMYAAMAATFRLAMWDPNSALILIPPPRDVGVVHWEVSPPFRRTTRAAHAWMQSDFNLALGKPWIFAAVLAACMTLLLVPRAAETRLGLFALALTGSGAIYLLTYFPFNVSAEYRYFHWSGAAAWLGLFMTAVAWRARKDGERRALPGGVRLGACLTIAAIAALVATPFELPVERRTITVTPEGEGALTVSSLRTASRPLWMGNFEGEVSTPDWQWDERGAHAANSRQALRATFETLHQDVRVGFQGGPDGGKARITDGGTETLVDTRADTPGEIVVDLPPQGTWTRRERQGSWLAPARTALCFAALAALLYWLSGKEGRFSRLWRVSGKTLST
ncbi:MAG: hypothetical protein LBF50_02135, partial [Azoarcus sp.]|nr:hypothetical protein [Azoarcus sp.]